MTKNEFLCSLLRKLHSMHLQEQLELAADNGLWEEAETIRKEIDRRVQLGLMRYEQDGKAFAVPFDDSAYFEQMHKQTRG